MKSTVKLRVKKLADGNGSYYLDWFQSGKRYYEYLKLYTVLSDRPTKTEPQGITPTHKRKQSIIAYLEANSPTKSGEIMTEHFRKFMGGRDFQIQNLTKEHLQNFSDISSCWTITALNEKLKKLQYAGEKSGIICNIDIDIEQLQNISNIEDYVQIHAKFKNACQDIIDLIKNKDESYRGKSIENKKYSVLYLEDEQCENSSNKDKRR